MTRCTWCRRTFTENEWVGHLTVRCWEHQKQPQWTTTPPTAPGWYWVRQGHNPPTIAFVREWPTIREPYGLASLLFGDAAHGPLSRFSHWLRIDPPEVPE